MQKILVRSRSGLVIQKSSRNDFLDGFLENEAQVYLSKGFKRSGGFLPSFIEDENHIFLPRYTRLPEHQFIIKQTEPLFFQPLSKRMSLAREPKTHQILAFKAALDSLNKTRAANIVMPCGAGKTVLGLMLAAKLGHKVAILVDTKQLAEQWAERIVEWLGAEFEFYSSGKIPKKDFVIVTIQSAYKIPPGSTTFDNYGTLILDESHVNGAEKWGRAVYAFNAPFRLALSATPNRPDGMHKLVNLHVGKPSVVLTQKDLEQGTVVKAKIILVPTGKRLDVFSKRYPSLELEFDSVKTYTALAEDSDRNKVIHNILEHEDKEGRDTLTVVNRLSAVRNLQEMCSGLDFGILVGGKDYTKEMEKQHLIGSYKVVRQALDKPSIKSVIMGAPFSNKEMIKQIIGRGERDLGDGQEPLFYDVIDSAIDIADLINKPDMFYTNLERMARSRINFYLTSGFEVFIKRGNKLEKVEKSSK